MRTLEKVESPDRESEKLDPASLDAIDKADASFQAGEGISINEARELNRK